LKNIVEGIDGENFN